MSGFILRRIARLAEEARQLSGAGLYSEAAFRQREICRLTRRYRSDDVEGLCGCLSQLGELLHQAGRPGRARTVYRAARERLEAHLRGLHPELFSVPEDSGRIRHLRLEYDLAVGQALNRLAHLYHRTGRGEAARPLVETALAIARPHLGVEHPEFAILLANLASLEHAAGHFGEAEALYRQALKMLRAALGETHHEAIRSQLDWALLCADRGRPHEAVALLEEALEASRRAWGEGHPRLFEPLGRLAVLYGALGDWTAAEWHLLRASEILRRHEIAPEWGELEAGLAELRRWLDKIGPSRDDVQET